ncbi:MAG: BlaI/MecI/CopY family transcriptional regulator [Bryobacteraceae bacterium]
MGLKRGVRLTRYEMELMQVLWSLGPASVREVLDALPEAKRPAYTTVQTMIYRLEEKAAVRRVKKIGNAHIFEAAISKQAAHRRLVDDLLQVFGGSAQPLVAYLLESGKLTLSDIKAVEQQLAQRPAGRGARVGPAGRGSKIPAGRGSKINDERDS